MADEHMWLWKDGAIMQIRWGGGKVFRKKKLNQGNFPTTNLTATNLQLNNSQISITDFDLEISKLQSLLIPTHVAVITNTNTNNSLFRSANTNLKTWSCTAANVRCCHSTEGNTATICYLTYHSFLITISSNTANTTAAQIKTPHCGAHSTGLQQHMVPPSVISIRAITNSTELCPVNSALSVKKHYECRGV